MALNSSGPISIAGTVAGQSIQIELNGNGTTEMSLNDSAVRTLAGVPSGEIVIPSNFYGKSNTFNLTISSSQTNLNLNSFALSSGWNGTSNLIVTINAGVYVYATSTGNAGLTINGSFPNGLSLINNGYITGKGGNGGTGGRGGAQAGTAGSAGGTALAVSSACSITNNNTIGGGGGGGGGGAPTAVIGGAGGGGGGGASFGAGGPGGTALSGGRTGAPGGSGTQISPGGGGGGVGDGRPNTAGGTGGSGGGLGSAGATGGRSQDNTYGGQGGGAAGNAITGNANITWVATGSRLGPIS